MEKDSSAKYGIPHPSLQLDDIRRLTMFKWGYKLQSQGFNEKEAVGFFFSNGSTIEADFDNSLAEGKKPTKIDSGISFIPMGERQQPRSHSV